MKSSVWATSHPTRPMGGKRFCHTAFVVAWSLCWSVAPAGAKNYIMHTKTLTSTCPVQQSVLMSNDVQLDICREWTHNRPITDWKMDTWQTITDKNDARLLQHSVRIAPGDSILYNSISYTTSVKLPSVLDKLTSLNLSIKISKTLFIYKQRVFSFVEIRDVPVVGHLSIANIVNIIDRKNIVSKHMISHGDIPWYAAWAVDILKNEILKSVDRYDDVSLRVYCA